MVKIFEDIKDRIVGGFRVNPRLQRTQASGTARGRTPKSKPPVKKPVKKGVVRLPNRSVPRNVK